MRFVATWLRVALTYLEKQNRRSHSVNENTNADFRLFAIGIFSKYLTNCLSV